MTDQMGLRLLKFTYLISHGIVIGIYIHMTKLKSAFSLVN